MPKTLHTLTHNGTWYLRIDCYDNPVVLHWQWNGLISEALLLEGFGQVLACIRDCKPVGCVPDVTYLEGGWSAANHSKLVEATRRATQDQAQPLRIAVLLADDTDLVTHVCVQSYLLAGFPGVRSFTSFEEALMWASGS